MRTRATGPSADNHFRDLSAYTDEDADTLDPWLGEGAERLVEALRAAGPEAQVWTPVPDGKHTASFWARRFAFETVIHRADATLALGAEFTVDADVALDAVDEWMELGSLPHIFDIHPEQRELLAPGHTIHLHATDTAPETAGE